MRDVRECHFAELNQRGGRCPLTKHAELVALGLGHDLRLLILADVDAVVPRDSKRSTSAPWSSGRRSKCSRFFPCFSEATGSNRIPGKRSTSARISNSSAVSSTTTHPSAVAHQLPRSPYRRRRPLSAPIPTPAQFARSSGSASHMRALGNVTGTKATRRRPPTRPAPWIVSQTSSRRAISAGIMRYLESSSGTSEASTGGDCHRSIAATSLGVAGRMEGHTIPFSKQTNCFSSPSARGTESFLDRRKPPRKCRLKECSPGETRYTLICLGEMAPTFEPSRKTLTTPPSPIAGLWRWPRPRPSRDAARTTARVGNAGQIRSGLATVGWSLRPWLPRQHRIFHDRGS